MKSQFQNLKFDKSSFVKFSINSIIKEYFLGKTLGKSAFGTLSSIIHNVTM